MFDDKNSEFFYENMNYGEFYKEELFPKEKIEVTDEYLASHGWVCYDYDSDVKHRWYTFSNVRIGRIKVWNDGHRKYYTLNLRYKDQDRKCIRFVSDIKAVIYSDLCGCWGTEIKDDGRYGDIEEDDRREEWMYNTYKEMTQEL